MFESLDDTIKTPEDIKSRLRAPFLGFIPAVTDSGKEGEVQAVQEEPNAWQRARTTYDDTVKVVPDR
jgi:hypothetical protein